MTPRQRRWLQLAVWLLVLALLVGAMATSGDMRDLVAEAARELDAKAVLVMLPIQSVALALCAASLWAFRPGVSFWGCAASRLLRDAGANLPIVPPGTGEAMGARALVLAGGGTRKAIVASTLDKLAETLAQIPFILLAGGLLISGWHPRFDVEWHWTWVLAAVLPILVLVAAWRRWGANSALADRLRAEWAKLAMEARVQRSGMPLALSLHFIGWLLSGLQIWLVAMVLGFDIGPFEAIAIESAAYAGRALLFFVPAGLVAQEAGMVAAGLVFGLAAPQSLALSLAIRIRDLLFAFPLAIWPLYEMRHSGRKAGLR